MKKVIDWHIQNDNSTKQKEIEIHELIHKKKSLKPLVTNNWRLNILRKAERILGKKISGTILEIGSGNGYASVFIAQYRKIEKIYCSEVTHSGVDTLIRNNFESNQIPYEKYELVLGSFNNIPLKNKFDYVIALGALHHSSDLRKTLDEIYSCLAEDGILIAQEPYTSDLLQNDYFIKRKNKIENVQGIVKVRNSERDDNFFRKCEYLTAAYHSGFDKVYFNKLKGSLKQIIYNFIKGNKVDKGLIILTKGRLLDSIPHRWS